jgi:starch phosphorylase
VGLPAKWVAMMKHSIATACQGFNMNRVLAEYAEKFYVPAKRQIARLSGNNHALLRGALGGEGALLEHWDRVVIRDVSTTVDTKDRVCQGDRVEVRCRVDFHGAPAELFAVELFLRHGDTDEFDVLAMTRGEAEGSSVPYMCTFEIAEHGLLGMNARLRPADAVLQDLHPELIKWAQ